MQKHCDDLQKQCNDLQKHCSCSLHTICFGAESAIAPSSSYEQGLGVNGAVAPVAFPNVLIDLANLLN
ncbi:hypothetical protein H6F93_09070 [Leptolyngbya sp. FACHB-671]|uniref:hypothetical protein n=1 Tax=Leptolyngbya sp. FACHB-671 TaxID=2692812 RepID=UPI0016879BEF|nr:hypothetical protein [Leptolyngbya sp. FACHB-671]MBD2067679.1 hypothetical protein [Leptolyngbya sp. FACHB-671]